MIWRRKAKDKKIEAFTFEKLAVVCTPGENDGNLLSAAADLAKRRNADLTVLSVIETPAELGWIARTTGASTNDITDRLIDERREKIDGLISQAGLNPKPKLTVMVGKPFLEIIRHVIAHKIDLVVKTAEELPGVGRYLFASTDQHLLRKCPCPVWLRLRDSPHRIKSILATVDVNHTTANEPETLAGLNRRIIETAAHIATKENAALHLLHVWDALGEGLVRMWSNALDPDAAVAAYVKDIEANHSRALDTLTDQARAWIGPDQMKHLNLLPRLERGDPRAVIPAQVHALEADVLVMGTIARTGVPGFVIGNTAEDILNSVDCSVVTVKPPHYISPVKAGVNS